MEICALLIVSKSNLFLFISIHNGIYFPNLVISIFCKDEAALLLTSADSKEVIML
jgi:hypothetical protein